MAVFRWCKGDVPAGMEIRQVYGILFTKDGRMLLAFDRGHYTLAGGKPQPGDADPEATLKRELWEEINVTVGEACTVGYQAVDEEDGTEPYAQLRMTAVPETLEDITPDPATGRTFSRLLTDPLRAASLLNWGEIGEAQIRDAMAVAAEKWGIVF